MVDDDGFVDVGKAVPRLPTTLRGILELGDGGNDQVREATSGRPADHSLVDVELDPPILEPHAIWALALNFQMHLNEMQLSTSNEFSQIFLRTPVSQTGHRRPLLCPDRAIAMPFQL